MEQPRHQSWPAPASAANQFSRQASSWPPVAACRAFHGLAMSQHSVPTANSPFCCSTALPFPVQVNFRHTVRYATDKQLFIAPEGVYRCGTARGSKCSSRCAALRLRAAARWQPVLP